MIECLMAHNLIVLRSASCQLLLKFLIYSHTLHASFIVRPISKLTWINLTGIGMFNHSVALLQRVGFLDLRHFVFDSQWKGCICDATARCVTNSVSWLRIERRHWQTEWINNDQVHACRVWCNAALVSPSPGNMQSSTTHQTYAFHGFTDHDKILHVWLRQLDIISLRPLGVAPYVRHVYVKYY